VNINEFIFFRGMDYNSIFFAIINYNLEVLLNKIIVLIAKLYKFVVLCKKYITHIMLIHYAHKLFCA